MDDVAQKAVGRNVCFSLTSMSTFVAWNRVQTVIAIISCCPDI